MTPFHRKGFEQVFLTLAVALPFLIAVLLGALLFADDVNQRALRDLEAQQQLTLREMETDLQLRFRSVAQALQVLSAMPGIKSLVDAPASSVHDPTRSEALNLATEEFLAFARAHRDDYDQVRFIDRIGNEVIRIDNGGGASRVVPEQVLQNKSNRYYVREGLRLNPGEIYLSKIDLNRENGQLELPHNPVVRFVFPVPNRDGQGAGLVVLNFRIGTLFSEIQQFHRTDSRLWIINAAGWFLLSDDPEQEWGFEIVQRIGESLVKRQPALWDHLRANDFTARGFSTDDGLIVSSLPVRMQANDLGEMYWKADQAGDPLLVLLIKIQQQELDARLAGTLGNIWLSFAGAALALLLLGALMVRYFLKLRDVRSRQVAQASQRKQEELFRDMIDLAPVAMLVADQVGIIDTANPEAHALFGYQDLPLAGMPLSCLIPERLRGIHAVHLSVYNQHPERMKMHHQRSLVGLRRDGSEMELEISIVPVGEGAERKTLAVLANLTQQKAYEKSLRDTNEWLEDRIRVRTRELEQAREAAEQANEAKSHFLANTSHQIRTPLNTILGMTHVLQTTRLTSRQKAHLTTINAASKSLIQLLTDVLDLARIEAGEMSLHKTTFILAKLLNELNRVFAPLAKGKNLHFSVDLATDIGLPPLISDQDKLRRILSNLLSNAIEFTHKGSVRLYLTRLTEGVQDQETIWLRFVVEDTGQGISQADQARLFEPFTQANDSEACGQAGAGLGLALVRRMAECLGGGVRLTSAPGQGASFTLELPFSAGDEKDVQFPDLTRRRKLRILIVDDQESELEVLAALCEQLGWEFETASSGKEMIEVAQRRMKDQRPFDCFIVDWRMPGIDGLTSLRLLRERIGAERMPGVVMITMADIRQLRAEIQQGVADVLLAKPVELEELFDRVNQAVRLHGATDEYVMDATSVGLGDGRLWLSGVAALVVDDNDMNRRVCAQILEQQGAIVTTAGNGQEMLDLLASELDGYDVVILDIQMPVMDGYAAARAVRSDPENAQLPIIALTAGVYSEQMQRALSAGMNQVCFKPIDPEILIRIVRQEVEFARGRAIPIVAASRFTGSHATFAAAEFSVPEGIDLEETRERLRGNLPLYRRMARRLLESECNLAERVKELLELGQKEEAGSELHAVRGLFATFGATDSTIAIKALETALAEERDCREALDVMARILGDTCARIEGWLDQTENPDELPGHLMDTTALNIMKPKLLLLYERLEDSELKGVDELTEEINGLLDSKKRREFAPVVEAINVLDFEQARSALEVFLDVVNISYVDEI